MPHQIALSDEEYAALAADAARLGQSVEDALHAVLAERYPALTDQRTDALQADEQARALGLDPAALSPLGRDLLAIRARGIATGEPLIASWEDLDAEIVTRRGDRYIDAAQNEAREIYERRHDEDEWEDEPEPIEVHPSTVSALSIRLPREELDALERAAADAGESLSEYVRRAITNRMQGSGRAR